MELPNFTFFLNFKNETPNRRIQITEPFKFDAASFTVEQDKDRFGRDVRYGNKEVSLFFYKEVSGEKINIPTQLPSGVVLNYLTMGFEWLYQTWVDHGSEMSVEFILNENGLEFITGDLLVVETDRATFIECKIQENTAIAQIKLDDDTKIDVFSDKDINLNTITPLTPIDFLLQAKPIYQFSDWRSNNLPASGIAVVRGSEVDQITGRSGGNNTNVPVTYGVQKSLGYMSNRYNLSAATGGYYVPSGGNNFVYIEAEEEISQAVIKITELNASTKYTVFNNVFGATVDNASGRVRLLVVIGVDVENPRLVETLYEKNWSYNPPFDPDTVPLEYLPTSFTLNVPLILRGERVYIYLETDAEAEFTGGDGTPIEDASFEIAGIWANGKISIEGVSTSIDSVIKVVPYYDLLKHIPYAINSHPIYAPQYDSSGVFNKQFATTGKLIRGFADKPFYVTFKGEYSDLIENCADYQITPSCVYAATYDKFYPNKEIGAFIAPAEVGFSSYDNQRYKIKGAIYKYEHFEQDRDEKNTVDGVHTHAEFKSARRKAANNLTVSIGYRRDPFGFEKDRRLSVVTGSGTTALDDDDNISLIDGIELPPGATRTYTNYLRMHLDGGSLQILNSTGLGEPGAGNFSWDKLGIGLGSVFTISNGDNIGTYNVLALEPTFITLSGSTPAFEGLSVITYTYTLNGVLYTNRTSEGFDSITGIDQPHNFSNLKYHIKRNLLTYWGSFLSTVNNLNPLNLFTNTFWKNNGELETQFEGGELIKDNANEALSNFTEAILSSEVIKTKLVVSFADAVALWDAMNTINDDGSIGGYLRVQDPNGRIVNGYPIKLDYEWVSQLMTVELEVRAESLYLEIDTLGTSLIKINNAERPDVILSKKWYRNFGDYVTLLDMNAIPLCDPKKFDKIKVNGVLYETVEDLAVALSEL